MVPRAIPPARRLADALHDDVVEVTLQPTPETLRIARPRRTYGSAIGHRVTGLFLRRTCHRHTRTQRLRLAHDTHDLRHRAAGDPIRLAACEQLVQEDPERVDVRCGRRWFAAHLFGTG